MNNNQFDLKITSLGYWLALLHSTIQILKSISVISYFRYPLSGHRSFLAPPTCPDLSAVPFDKFVPIQRPLKSDESTGSAYPASFTHLTQ